MRVEEWRHDAKTGHGLVGVVDAQTPHRVWSTALEMLGRGEESVTDIALLGFEVREDEERARSQPVEGLRAVVHGHFPVKDVERRCNRWKVDTGAGIQGLDRLSLLEVNTPEIRSWTLDVDEQQNLVGPRMRRTQLAARSYPDVAFLRSSDLVHRG